MHTFLETVEKLPWVQKVATWTSNCAKSHKGFIRGAHISTYLISRALSLGFAVHAAVKFKSGNVTVRHVKLL